MRKSSLILSALIFLCLLTLLPREAFGRRARELDTIAKIQAVVKGIQIQGTEVWVDTAEPELVRRATELGATGGTSNPALIAKAIKEHPEDYKETILRLAIKYGYVEGMNEYEIEGICKNVLMELTADLIQQALETFSGPMSWEVDPRFYDDAEEMVKEAESIYRLADERGLDANRIFIKIPATKAGLKATEELISRGINVNFTLVFSITQAVEAIYAYKRGISKAKGKGFPALDAIKLVISPFLGRWDDRHKKMVTDNQGNPISGLYFAKLLQGRVEEALEGWDEELDRPRLVMASIRSVNHVRELIGADIMTIPPNVLLSAAFADIDTSQKRIDNLYSDRDTLQSLTEALSRDEWYKKSLQPDGMRIAEFDQHPLVQEGNTKFIQPYKELLGLIKAVLVGSSLP